MIGLGTIKTKVKDTSLSAINADMLNGGKYFMQVKLSHEGKSYELPNEPLVSLSTVNTVVKTATVGKQRKGTVKEWICAEDWNITIVGTCASDTNTKYPKSLSKEDIKNWYLTDSTRTYPAEQVAMLVELRNIADSLDIVSNPYFELFGIRRLVIDSIDFDPMEGTPGAQTYKITATSDQDFYADMNDQL